MKKIKFAAFIVAAATSTFFMTGCDKDDDAAPTRTELLTRAEWKDIDLLFAGQSLIGDTSANYTPGDVKLRFTNAGDYTINDAGASENGKWRFIDNETKIILTDADNDSDTVAVKTLTNTNLDILWYDGLIEQRFNR